MIRKWQLPSECGHTVQNIAMHRFLVNGGKIWQIKKKRHQDLSFSKLSTSSLSLLGPYFDYVRVNISLNNFSLLSVVNVYAPPIRSFPTDSRANSFSPSIFSFSKNLFILGDFNSHHPFWDSKGASDPGGEEVFDCVISPDLHPLMIMTYLLFSIALLVVVPLLTSPLLPSLSPSLVSRRCFRTWVVITYQFY